MLAHTSQGGGGLGRGAAGVRLRCLGGGLRGGVWRRRMLAAAQGALVKVGVAAWDRQPWKMEGGLRGSTGGSAARRWIGGDSGGEWRGAGQKARARRPRGVDLDRSGRRRR